MTGRRSFWRRRRSNRRLTAARRGRAVPGIGRGRGDCRAAGQGECDHGQSGAVARCAAGGVAGGGIAGAGHAHGAGAGGHAGRDAGPETIRKRLAELAGQADNAAALADAAGTDLTIFAAPGEAAPAWVEAYGKLVQPEDATLARLKGWLLYRQGKLDEARGGGGGTAGQAGSILFTSSPATAS